MRIPPTSTGYRPDGCATLAAERSPVAQRVFIHVGTMKSGTTFLQKAWWRNREELARQGLLLPGSRVSDHFSAAILIGQHHPALADFSRQQVQTWERLLSEIAAWPQRATISHEVFSAVNRTQAAGALSDLQRAANEVHIVLTVRDLARQLPSHWQQAVKSHSSLTLNEYARRVADDPGHRFWVFQDVPAILDRWGQGIPSDRVHVVVTPQDATPDWLWRATCRLFSVDPSGLRSTERRQNEALGIAEVEVMRRLQALVPAEERDLQMSRLIKGAIARNAIARSGPGERFVLPPDLHEWAMARSIETVEILRERGYDVIGDLSDLTPRAATGRTPDEVTSDEVAEVAVAALARMVARERDHRREVARLTKQRARLRRQLRQAQQPARPAPWPRRAIRAVRTRWRRVSRRG
jgi:hypothetical protein